MATSNSRSSIAQTPTLRWNEDGLPESVAFNDTYFSTDDGLAEANYVFLQQNQLKQRFSTLKDNHCFIIGETGFGTGLNFLATWDLWVKTAPATARLHFISVEKYPLSQAQLLRALLLWPSLEPYCKELLALYPSTKVEGFHRLSFADSKIQLTLIIDDAQAALNHLLVSEHPHHLKPQWQGVDAWFLDGFTPAKNPAMWSEELLKTVAKLTKSQGTLATFTAASSVQERLQTTGFTIKKIPGFGKKREMIRATFNSVDDATDDAADSSTNHKMKNVPLTTTNHYATQSIKKSVPWPVIKDYRATEKSESIVVLGAGLAGCHTARALADCGYKIILIDRANTTAAGASGNAQGVVYAKLSPQPQPLSQFNLFSLLYAQHYYRRFWSQKDCYGQQCGVLQLSYNAAVAQQHRELAAMFNRDDNHGELLQYLSQQQASEIVGLPVGSDGLYFPNSGWLDPSAVCRLMVAHPSITVKLRTTVEAVDRQSDGWRLSGHRTHGNSDYKRITNNGITKPWAMNAVHTLVIANATDAYQLPLLQWLPTRAIRGQVTLMPTSALSQKLKTVVCGRGYIAPTVDNHHYIGASFNLHDSDTTIKQRDHLTNLQHVTNLLPTVETGHVDHQTLHGRTAFRCATPDYLPMVGPVPDTDAFDRSYAMLRHNARANSDHNGSYLPALYLNIGHGSRGLCYTPLCAALIASIISGEPPPLPQAIIQVLNPARFIIRDLMRNRR